MLKKLDIGTSEIEQVEAFNVLVDAVNELQKKFGEIKIKTEITEECLHPTAKVDPYAEQRKWIGKLCRFRDNDSDEWNYGILKSTNDIECSFPFTDMESYEWAICEPVKPDDDIIYKGNNNERRKE